MAKINFSAKLKNSKTIVDIQLTLLSFVEDDLYYVFSPELDIYGYGQSKSQARDSFTTTFKETMSYMVNKNTLSKELKSLGWTVKKNKKGVLYIPPLFSHIIEENDEVKNIVNTKAYTKYNHAVQLPAVA
jgi:hypothetical protein